MPAIHSSPAAGASRGRPFAAHASRTIRGATRWSPASIARATAARSAGETRAQRGAASRTRATASSRRRGSVARGAAAGVTPSNLPGAEAARSPPRGSGDPVRLGAPERRERHLGGGVEPHGDARHAYAAVHVELNAADRVPTAHVRLAQRGEEERRQDRQVDLPAVRVAREAHERAVEPGEPVGGSRAVREDERRRARAKAAHGRGDVGAPGELVADPDDGERRAAEPDAGPGVLEHLVPVAAERRRGASRIHPDIVVSQHRDGGGGEAAELLAHPPHLGAAAREVVARQHDEVGRERVRLRDRAADDLGRGAWPDVEIGQLRDAQAIVRRVEAGDVERDVLGARHRLLGRGEHGERPGRAGRAEDRRTPEEPPPTEALHPPPARAARAPRQIGADRSLEHATPVGDSTRGGCPARHPPGREDERARGPRAGAARVRPAALRYRPRRAAGGTPSAFAIFSMVSSGGDRCPRSSIETYETEIPIRYASAFWESFFLERRRRTLPANLVRRSMAIA